MSKLRRKFITVLAVLFCALLTISTALIIPKTKTADAYSTPQTAAVSELYRGNGKFSAKNLRTLYGKLVSGATKYEDIVNALSGSSSTISVKNFATTDTIVEFGGKVWTAVYLSKAQHNLGQIAPDNTIAGYAGVDDIVLTLWLANPDSNKMQWQYATGDKIYGSPSSNYPLNMYGTSYIRSVVLNNGGDYWSESGSYTGSGSSAVARTDNTLITGTSKSQNNIYANFTMTNADGAANSVIDYLVAPRYISWQHEQRMLDHLSSSSGLQANYRPQTNLSNDAWGTISSGFNSTFDYQSKDKYNVWKDDLVWLPSMTETGYGLSGNQGIWQTTVEQRTFAGTNSDWCYTRSSSTTSSRGGDIYVLTCDGDAGAPLVNEAAYVRPAIHLNLTKAAKAAKGISYDAVTPTKVEETAEIDKSETDHTFEHVYDGNEVKVTIADYQKLDVENNAPYVGTNDYSQTEAKYDKDSGEFTATKPKKDADETYIIKVTPKTDPSDGKKFVWDDNDGSEARYYKINIKLATISTTQWGNPEVSNGESILQDTDKIKSSTQKTDIVYKEKYYRVEPEGSPSTPQPSDWITNGGWAVDWKDRSDTDSYFKTSKKGDYVVYYEISADYHETKRGSYTVTVAGTDTMELSIKKDIPNETFGDTKAADLKSSLLANLGTYVTFKTSSKTYTGQDLTDLLSLLEIVVLDESGTEVELATGRNYYNAGTYSLHVRYKSTVSDANKTFAFKWENDEKIALTVDKMEFVVGIAAAAGKSLSHVYGSFDSTAIEYDIDEDNLPDGETKDDLPIEKGTFKIVKDDDTLGDTLGNRTAVGTYKIKGVASEDGNYDIIFDEVSYSVTKRAVTLKAADEEAEYGTDYSNYVFGDMTRVEGSLASFDSLSNLLKNATRYYLWMNENEVELSSDLAIGEYELRAEITSDNYTFTVESGKLKITKANFKMDGVKLENKGYIYDGEPHEAKISGELPSEEITVSYRYVNSETGEELEGAPVEVGLYLVYATFSHNNPNYNQITGKAAYIRIAYTQEELNKPYPPLPSDAELAAAADLAKKKNDAKKSLDEEAQAKKDAIDANEDMTAEDKKAAKDEIDKELAEGNAAIDKAENASDINKAFDEGKKTMEDTVELAETKTDAKKDLDKTAKDKKDAIDADSNLTAEEKTAAKSEVDKELEAGKKEIDKSTNATDVEAAEGVAEKKIEDLTAMAQKKGAAKSELDKAAQAKKDAIDNDPNLTDEEKAAAKAEVDKELEEGKKAIDDATDLSAVQSAESSTKTNIENIKPEHKGDFPWWILAIIAGALVLVTVLIIVIVKRRGSDDDDGGYDDFYDDEYDYEEEEESDDGDEEAYGF